MSGKNYAEPAGRSWQGRWPANIIFSHLPECRQVGVKKVKGSQGVRGSDKGNTMYGSGKGLQRPITGQKVGYVSKDGTEEVPEWRCAEGCPVRMLDEQTEGTRASRPRGGQTIHTTFKDAIFNMQGEQLLNGEHLNDSGGASRFFYCAKASRSERGKDNTHATVKPLKLMEYLCRLTMPPGGGVVLDPFMGSGTTLLACARTGRRGIGVERDEEACKVAKGRLQNGMD